jgi:transposase-like protein
MGALYEAVQALEEEGNSSHPHQIRKNNVDREKKTESELNAGRKWTEDDDAHLKSLYLQGAEMDEICRCLQRRPRGVRRRLEELCLIYIDAEKAQEKKEDPIQISEKKQPDNRGKRWSREEHERLIEMWLEDGRITEIARELRRTPYAIRCRLEKYGLLESALSNTPWTEEDTRQLFRMVDRKCSIKEMSEHFGRTEKALEARLFYMGLSKKAPKLFD